MRALLEDAPSPAPTSKPTTEEEGCELLGGTLAYCIQFLLGVAAIASLVYKRHIERPQRPWIIWAFDVGKQLVGGFLVHFMNIGVSSIMGKDGDECAWCVESCRHPLCLAEEAFWLSPSYDKPTPLLPPPTRSYYETGTSLIFS